VGSDGYDDFAMLPMLGSLGKKKIIIIKRRIFL
jgi:hypothetical protein